VDASDLAVFVGDNDLEAKQKYLDLASRYKMYSIQKVNTLGGARNKLPSKITEVLITKSKQP